MTNAYYNRDWDPREDNMSDMVEVEVFGANERWDSLRDLDERQLLILHDACHEELQMRGVIGV